MFHNFESLPKTRISSEHIPLLRFGAAIRVLALRLRGRYSITAGDKGFFPISAVGPTQFPMQWVSETVCPGVRLPGSEDNHMTASVANVEIAWMDVSTSPYVFV